MTTTPYRRDLQGSTATVRSTTFRGPTRSSSRSEQLACDTPEIQLDGGPPAVERAEPADRSGRTGSRVDPPDQVSSRDRVVVQWIGVAAPGHRLVREVTNSVNHDAGTKTDEGPDLAPAGLAQFGQVDGASGSDGRTHALAGDGQFEAGWSPAGFATAAPSSRDRWYLRGRSSSRDRWCLRGRSSSRDRARREP